VTSKKTALYCRTANAPMGDDTAILAQKEILLGYAREYGYENVEVYEDSAVSGASLYDRPALYRLQADMEACMVERVVVCVLTRIGRNTHETYKWLAGLDKLGVELVSLDCSIA